MASLHDKAPGGVLGTFSTRTSATAAGFARSSQLSNSRPGQAVRSVKEGGMDRPSQYKSHPAGSLSSSQLGGPPCRVICLAFGLIGGDLAPVLVVLGGGGGGGKVRRDLDTVWNKSGISSVLIPHQGHPPVTGFQQARRTYNWRVKRSRFTSICTIQ
jgi:hypothetical protein